VGCAQSPKFSGLAFAEMMAQNDEIAIQNVVPGAQNDEIPSFQNDEMTRLT